MKEAYKLVPEAAKRNVKNILITHATFPTTFYSVEDQKSLLIMELRLNSVIQHGRRTR